ncbi:TRAF3-interacting protein 1-like isoform X1 [Anneissia japonica]|uniref:TRAF3-interacting protein 1-like isoform X1 n=1 Tax=Anneissia japonica TaxID=1529436 RepID=UPI001425B085|nr:TRAF3-interacting protein 1-like isoform X1 [Anneissia japonica]
MGDNFVKKTQDTLGNIIKKPPLTEKLLNKPPFRFLHDVFMEVIRTTGFMKGLYTATEMDSQNVKMKDRESKVAFLQKAIDVISMVTGKPLSVKTSKIVAGHEPEKTNEMLQALAKAILDKLDSSDAVKKVLKGEKPKSSKPPKPKKEETDDRKKSGDKRSQDNKDRKDSAEKKGGSERNDSTGRKGSADDNKQRSGSKERDRSRERSRDSSKNQKEHKKDRDKEKERIKDEDNKKDKESEKDRERRERKRRKELEDAARREKEEQNEGQNDDDESDDTEDLRPAAPESKEGSGRMPRPSSAKGKRSRPLRDGDDSDSDKDYDQERQDGDLLPSQVQASRQMTRPSSARPAPPKIKQEPVEDPNIRIGSGKQVTNVIVDNGINSDDDDDAFLVEEAQPLTQDDQQNGPDASPATDKQIGLSEVDDDGQHGSLVKKIMETKTELERKDQKKDDKPIILDAARKKERQMVQREVEKLRGFIQTLTRSANPLGKTMDYLQEDMDSMQKELDKWKRENKEHALAIKREENVTEGELEPLHAQLAELDQSIADQVELIGAVKSNILRNEEKMTKMMNSVVLS